MSDEIVIFAEPEIERRWGEIMARIPGINVGQFGDTEKQAVARLEIAVRCAIEVERRLGTLDDWLRDSGLTWGLASDFPEAKSRFRG